MPLQNRIVRPGFKIGTVITEEKDVLTPPSNWAFLPAGDGPLTRNVKMRGICWQVQVKRGRRNISKGIWVKEEYILAAKDELEAKRATPEQSLTTPLQLVREQLHELSAFPSLNVYRLQ